MKKRNAVLRRCPFVVCAFLLIMTLLGFLPGCAARHESGDDDHAANATDDDDATAADDDNDDASPTGDDDNNDISPDDDASPGPLRLLLMGTTGQFPNQVLASWAQTDAGWRDLPLPTVPLDGGNRQAFGPIAIRDGSAGLGAVNNFLGTGGGPGIYGDTSVDYHWLSFDIDAGWQLAPQMAVIGTSAVISQLQAPADDIVWADGESFDWYEAGDDVSSFDSQDDLYIYNDGPPGAPLLSLGDQIVDVLAMPASDWGLAAIENVTERRQALWSWNGTAWTSGPLPTGLTCNFISWMTFVAPGSGYGVCSTDETEYQLYRIDGDQWTQIPPPAGCENVRLIYVAAYGDYAVAIDTAAPSSQFWERRGETWSCRTVTAGGATVSFTSVAVTTDQRAFVVGGDAAAQYVFEITATDILSRDPPPDASSITAVLPLGAGAPPVSYACEGSEA